MDTREREEGAIRCARHTDGDDDDDGSGGGGGGRTWWWNRDGRCAGKESKRDGAERKIVHARLWQITPIN